MIANIKLLQTDGLTLGGAEGTPGTGDTERKSNSANQPWRCPVPTLEGLPRFSPTPGRPTESKPAPQAGSDQFVTRTEGRRRDDVANDGDSDDFVLRLYRRDIRREPLLTSAEETELVWRSSFDDEAARERLVLGHLRLVVHIAFEYRSLGLPLSDLINEGNLGLMRAAERFDPIQSQRFANYAGAWIRHRMRRALSRQAWPMRLPADFSWQQSQVRDAESRLSAQQDHEAQDVDVAAECGFSLPTVQRLRSNRFPRCIPLHSPWPNGEDGEVFGDILPDEQTPAPDQELARRGDREFVERLLTTLKPREQRVLRLRFGLDDGCERTLDEVGRVLGYVRQGIHKIESSALAKLRKRVNQLGMTNDQ